MFKFSNKGISVPFIIVIIILCFFVISSIYYYFYFQKKPSGVSTFENESIIKCGTIKISLPSSWNNLKILDKKEIGGKKMDKNGCISDEIGCFCTRGSTKDDTGVMFSVTISDLKDNPACDIESFQKYFLEKTASEIQAVLESNEKASEEYSELFGKPSLKFTVTSPISISRDIFFIKNCKLYLITLASRENIFDEVWLGIEQSIKDIEFLE